MNEYFSLGYVILSRNVFDSNLWQLPPDHFRVAIYLITKARHKTKPHKLPDGLIISRGELVTSMSAIAENCSYYENRTVREMSRKKVLNILQNLENIGFLIRNSHRLGTHIKLCNYESYQNPESYKSHTKETLEEHEGNTEGTRRDTNNKVNNENNEKKVNNDKSKSASAECDLILEALPEERRKIILEWVEHKREKRDGYKPRGLKALIRKLDKYDNQTIETAIEDAMSNGWKGIVFEKIATMANSSTQSKPVHQSFGGMDL